MMLPFKQYNFKNFQDINSHSWARWHSERHCNRGIFSSVSQDEIKRRWDCIKNTHLLKTKTDVYLIVETL